MTITKRRTWAVLAVSAVMLLAACIPPKPPPPPPPDPGPGYADNATLMERARDFAAAGGLDIVEFDGFAPPFSQGWWDTQLCGATTGYRINPYYNFQAICVNTYIPSFESQKGTRTMVAVGDFWVWSMSFHGQFSGQPFDRGPFGSNARIAQCFAHLHEANPAFLGGGGCSPAELDHIGALEMVYPLDGSPWPPLPWPYGYPWLGSVGAG
ncbi:MAG: hypothetical protein M5U31_13705 [Acidimicrobiia bacterium]|nr:hypothetical protein [Acidimicrobiia bacterium]